MHRKHSGQLWRVQWVHPIATTSRPASFAETTMPALAPAIATAATALAVPTPAAICLATATSSTDGTPDANPATSNPTSSGWAA